MVSKLRISCDEMQLGTIYASNIFGATLNTILSHFTHLVHKTYVIIQVR